MNLLIRLLVNAVALAVAVWIVPGISLEESGSTGERAWTLIIVAVIFGLVNAIIKPIVSILSLPFIILTLGLVIFVINALMLWLTSWITDQFNVQFAVDGFWSAFFGALIITIVSWALDAILPD